MQSNNHYLETHANHLAGLIVSNLSGLGMLIVLYRIVLEDFDDKVASRTVLYFSVFPAAFFFAFLPVNSVFDRPLDYIK
jgi:Gpi18-like mannosyltransferase